MKQSLVQKLTTGLAEQMTLDNFLTQVGCVRVYQIQENWQLEELKKSAHVSVINSVKTFKDACLSNDKSVIVVPNDAAITQSQAKRIMGTVTQDRTVFWQAKK